MLEKGYLKNHRPGLFTYIEKNNILDKILVSLFYCFSNPLPVVFIWTREKSAFGSYARTRMTDGQSFGGWVNEQMLLPEKRDSQTHTHRFREDIHKKKFFFSGLTTKVLPFLH